MTESKKFLVMLTLFASSIAAAQTYRAANLGTLGGHWSYPAAINGRGHVAGSARLTSGKSHPFLWNGAMGMLDLDLAASDSSGAYGMNSGDQVVGANTTSLHAFLWSGGSGMQDLGTLGGCCSGAFAINDQSVVVGSSTAGTGEQEAFVWTQATGMKALSSGKGSFSNTAAYAVNQKGFVAGAGNVVGSALSQHALLWAPTGGVTDLGTLGGSNSMALGINRSNQIVGWALTASGETHAFVWSRASGMQDIGVLSGFFSCQAAAINDAGQVVGTCFPPVPTDMPHAFIWSAAAGMQDLNALLAQKSDVTIGEALAINAQGQIAVWAASSARFNPSRAILLTPQ